MHQAIPNHINYLAHRFKIVNKESSLVAFVLPWSHPSTQNLLVVPGLQNSNMPSKAVLVTGANGFIGYAVCRAFALAGWTTYGLMRSDRSIPELVKEEIIPIVGSAADPASFVADLPPIDVVICCSGDPSNFGAHFKEITSLIRSLSKIARSKGHGKPLAIISSGCKDYGMTPRHGDPDLAPHTEESPLNFPPVLGERANGALDMMTKYTKDFDCVITRPTTLYGRSSSFYGLIFLLAEQAKSETDGVLAVTSDADAICHGTHVDDVAAAYLAIAEAPRDVVAGQAYNISSHRYETLGEIVEVVEKAHGIKVEYVDADGVDKDSYATNALFNFPQWVDSEKIRKHTGWRDKKPLFHEGYNVYRKAYEAAAQAKTEQHERVMRMVEGRFGIKD
ncbi:uncharacterized protein PV06_00927 [Exophiala oligosperma]|uniref:NAD-dependent epimerase/dehydratase domain-containing protein n=1 Tax=Exophiala oligosperma TaxID=215243 RepID=A0A0D2E0I1_9EURO|nr:uncharacterized protein PV06_00927 [Exophiala oligosperma]KIW48325.1 hypothetical protein PV06_00927 [Exophiala oligosperma]